jgi:Fe-S-cluster containining protein
VKSTASRAVLATVTGDTEAPECLRCGACCFSELDTYVRVSGDDYTRLGDRAESLVRFDGHRAYMRMQGGHCAALMLDRVSSRFVCAVYEARPATCRELERGGGACAAERAIKSDRPLSALRLAPARARD